MGIKSIMEISTKGILLKNEPLWRHCTMLIGGPAQFYAVPINKDDLALLLRTAIQNNWDCFILGGGSNVLFPDEGLPGLTIDMALFNTFHQEGDCLVLGAGLDISHAVWKAGTMGLAGLEFFFGMPGTVGGAVWMNARCYGGEIADRFIWADVMKYDGSIRRYTMDSSQWDYKVSPFQRIKGAILQCGFRMENDNAEVLRQTMLDNRNDRELKGHYRAPCAGSAFKNNRDFGKSSGEIIDNCGLRGMTVGQAGIAEWHANIFINRGAASARDMRMLIDQVIHRVKEVTGCTLEPEILIL